MAIVKANILAPHLDDAALSCWHQIDSGSQIITVFAGSPESSRLNLWDRLTSSSDPMQSMATRNLENNQAIADTPSVATNLQYIDYQYAHPPRDITEMAGTVREVVGNEAPVIASTGIGTYQRKHPDHITTRNIGKALLDDGIDVSFYADLPYILPIRDFDEWPARISTEKVKRALDMEVAVEPIELSEEQQLSKYEAVRAYKSQFAMVNALALGALSRPEAYRWEVIFRPV